MEEWWGEYISRLQMNCKDRGIPFHATFEITPLCNFDCNMCYIRMSSDEMQKRGKLLPADDWIHFGEETRKMGTLMISITGGEAVTRFDFPQIYVALVKMGFLITLRSNGYLLDEKIIELFRHYKPYCVQITLYGASDATYEKICGVKNGFTVVSRNIELLKANGIDVKTTMTITNENYLDFPAVCDWATTHNLRVHGYGGLLNLNRGGHNDVSHLQYRSADSDCEITSDMVFKPYIPPTCLSQVEGFSMCASFGAMYSITWDGKMSICNGFTQIWEDPKRDTLANAYSRLYDRLEKIKRPKECEHCEYFYFCSGCPSKFYSVTGDPEKTCEEICREARRAYKKKLLVNAKE